MDTMPRKATRLVLVSVLALWAGACKKPYIDWNAPTTFQFKGLTPKQASVVEEIFRRHEVAWERVGDAPITYEVSDIAKARDLAFLLQDLRVATKADNIDAPFESAQIVFGGIEARGDVSTSITVTVSPGASAYIADGPRNHRWRPISVNAQGVWKGEVNTGGLVAREGGWVYIAAERGGMFRYYRVNVLSERQQRVSYADVRRVGLGEPRAEQPAEQEAQEKKGGRWPWSRSK